MIKYIEHLKKTENLKFHHKGVVVDNNDPKMLGRVKAAITGLLEDSTEMLPWVAPLNPFGLGGSNNCSSFSVPEIGSELIVVFPYEEIYFPFYIGYWQSSVTHQSDFDEDYPETYGFKDNTGNILKVNKGQQYAEIEHSSGAKIKIDDEGSLFIDLPGDKHINIIKDKLENINGQWLINIVGNTTIDCNGIVSIKSASLVEIDGGTNSLKGFVNGDCLCAFTQKPHAHISSNVKGSLG